MVNAVTVPGDGATIDFQDNGNVVLSHNGVIESYTYTIKPDSKVEIDGDISEIRNLTATSVTLFFRDDYLPGEYSEILLNLKR
jgi:predicted glutamine amidotransferase